GRIRFLSVRPFRAEMLRLFTANLRLERSLGELAMILRVCRTTDRSEPIDWENCKARIAIGLRNSGPAAGTGQLATSLPDIITSSLSARPIGIAIGTAGTTIFGMGTVAVS